jgi:pimeloyl-ACP methyl ester carboxylesterase
MSRHFVQIGDRLVHYRRLGAGPAVLVLHGSPQSSRAVVPLGEALAAAGFTAIAPDTPGNGLSTPLAGEPSIEDYAEALLEFADALGLGRLALYGFHTGAAIAAVFAARYPARVAAIVCNGLSAWNDAERLDLKRHYLPRFVPAWDGSHMAWAWARVEEHTVFFPWHRPEPAARMVYDVPSVAATHLNALDLLESGDGYRAPYAAAFGFRTEDWLERITAPLLVAATVLDPLRPHLERPAFAGTPFRIFPDSAALTAAATAHLKAHPGDKAPVAPPSGGELQRGWLGGIGWTGCVAGAGRPLVLLHGAGTSRRIFDAVLPALASRRPVVALDLPGHGLSSPGDGRDDVQLVAATCRDLGLESPAIAGIGWGGVIAAALHADGIAAVAATLGPVTRDAEIAPEALAPSLAPSWEGAHLLRAFRIARWQRLFDPWCRRDRTHARPQGNLDPSDVQAAALDLLRAGDAWTAAVTAERQSPSAPRICDSEDSADWVTSLIGFGL